MSMSIFNLQMHKMILHNKLDDATLIQLMQYTQNKNVGIISAFVERCTEQENLDRTIDAEFEICKAGYGQYRFEGRYSEHSHNVQNKYTHERAILVIGANQQDSGNLKGLLVKLGKQYEQNSLLFRPYNQSRFSIIKIAGNNSNQHDVDASVICNAVCIEDVDDTNLNQLYSRMRGREFAFNSYEQIDTYMTALAKHVQNKSGNQSQNLDR